MDMAVERRGGKHRKNTTAPYSIERLKQEIIKRTTIEPNTGCWLYTLVTNNSGYGMIYIGSYVQDFIHRVSYQIYKGEIPEGYQIDHLCKVKSCSNPNHLEAVTRKENTLRGTGPEGAKNYFKNRTSCKKGHTYTEENTVYTTVKHKGKEYKCRYCNICRLASSQKYNNKRKKLNG